MARLQYKICTSQRSSDSGQNEIHVYGREIADDGTIGPWHHIVAKSAWVEPWWPTHGRRLKALLRSLA